MRWPVFLFYNALGGIVWTILYGTGAYMLGDAIHRISGPVGIVCLVLAVLLTIGGLIFLKRNEKRLEEIAERALPGPLDHPQQTKS
jgi:membrane protein DedA with SNARE-associated domain